MLNFNLSIENPWAKEDFKNIYCISGLVGKNKSWELQCYRYSREFITLSGEFSFRGKDHAGLMLSVGLCGYVIEINLRDCRHWDSKQHKWENI